MIRVILDHWSGSGSPQRNAPLIGSFIKCHRVCRNNNEVSFVTNLLLLHVTNAGKFRLNMNFWLSFIEEETNKLLRRCNMFPFFIWTLVNTQQTFLELTYGRIQKIRSHSSVLCNNKKENWRYLKYSCYPRPKRERCITRKQKNKRSVNLKSRTEFITLAMLEHMRLTCYVLPQGKELNVRG